ncbi:hypothetical protein [Niabella aquatica]
MIEIKPHKDISSIGLGSWGFNGKIIHSITTEFTGNCLSSHDTNCLNEIIIYFGYRPKKNTVFEVVNSIYDMRIGKTVCINIFSEDKTQWESVESNNEKLYVKFLNKGLMRLSFSSIAMQNISPFDKRILFCSGLIQEQDKFSNGFQNLILRKLFSMRGK